jgi:hypothetical protein
MDNDVVEWTGYRPYVCFEIYSSIQKTDIMKSIFKFSAIIALFFSTAIGLAKEPVLLLSGKEDARTLVFRLDTPAKETAIRFIDTQGNTIYSERIGEVADYGKRFDLKELPVGYYFLEVENSYKEIVYTIEISNSDSKIVKKKEKLKPVFRKKGNKLFLNLLNLKESDVEIKVFDSNNRLLYQEVSKGKLIVEKAINFEKAFEDSYMVMVIKDHETYYENILVN